MGGGGACMFVCIHLHMYDRVMGILRERHCAWPTSVRGLYTPQGETARGPYLTAFGRFSQYRTLNISIGMLVPSSRQFSKAL